MDRTTYKLLSAFYKNGRLSRKEAYNITKYEPYDNNNPNLNFLLTGHLIEDITTRTNDGTYGFIYNYKITIEGCSYVEEHRRQTALQVFVAVSAFSSLVNAVILIWNKIQN